MNTDGIKTWLAGIELDTSLLRMHIEIALRNKKMSEIDARFINWHLDRIDKKTNYIKELAEQ